MRASCDRGGGRFGRDAAPQNGREIIFSILSTTYYCVIYLPRHRTALGGHNGIPIIVMLAC